MHSIFAAKNGGASECLLSPVIKHAWQLAFKARTMCEWGMLARVYNRQVQRKHTPSRITADSSASFIPLQRHALTRLYEWLISARIIPRFLAVIWHDYNVNTGQRWVSRTQCAVVAQRQYRLGFSVCSLKSSDAHLLNTLLEWNQ